MSENPPMFYKITYKGIMFVWASGLTFSIDLWKTYNGEWIIINTFDHLARTEVLE